MNQEQFLTELRAQLMDAAARRAAEREGATSGASRRGATWWVPIAAGFVLVLGAVAAVFALSEPTSVSATVEIVPDGDHLVVRLVDLESRPEEIERAASRAGLDIEVTTVPVGPTNVGRFVGGSGSELPPEIRVTEGSEEVFRGFRIPAGWKGQLRLQIGRPARDGEPWTILDDAIAPGGTLACRDLLGRTVATVRTELDLTRLAVRWFVFDPNEQEVTGEELERYEGWRVVRLVSPGPDEVWAQVTEDGSWPFASTRPDPLAGC